MSAHIEVRHDTRGQRKGWFKEIVAYQDHCQDEGTCTCLWPAPDVASMEDRLGCHTRSGLSPYSVGFSGFILIDG